MKIKECDKNGKEKKGGCILYEFVCSHQSKERAGGDRDSEEDRGESKER